MKKKNIQISISLVVQAIILGVFLSFVSFASTNNNELCPVDVDVVMIMDISGSMNQGTSTTKIEAAKEAANSFVDNLKSNDQSALVSFSTTASLEKTLSNEHSATKSAIDSLVVYGATNIGDAIDEGINELNSGRANTQATKAMILLTDGKANKPNGNGRDENPLDVAYAEEKAQEAADLGYKIFTIGLGSDSEINETMLQNIADLTGAQYYPAPDGSSLAAIYNQISQAICQYGSISGYKYNDLNNNGQIDPGEETLSDWEIVLDNGITTSSQITLDGCYTFAGLADGQYTVSEVLKPGWVQTYPTSTHSVTISGYNNQENVDFANYFLPECNSSILGKKIDYLTELGLTDWFIELRDGDGVLLATTTTDTYGDYNFAGLCKGTYWVNEVQQEGWIQKLPTSTPYWQLELGEDEATTTINFVNYLPICGNEVLDQGEECDDGNLEDEDGCSAVCLIEQPTEPVCGNGSLETGEECDDGNLEDEDGCSAVCLIEQEPEPEPEPTGGGGGGPPGLIIFNEKIKEFYSDRIIISWFTSIKATSRVIYDTFSGIFDYDSPPNYGYAYSTIEKDTPANPNGVTYHEVEVTGLSPGIPYYFRVVSQASPEKVGQELGLTLPAEEEEEEEEEEVSQPVEQAAPAEEETAPAVGPAEEEVVVEEEPIIEEEPVFEEEIIPEEVTQKEEEEETGTFLAAMAGLFTGGNFCWILTLIITALIILYLLTRRKKKQEKEIKKRYGDLIIAIIILIILIFLIKCYLLIIPILILVAYLLYEAFFKEDKD